MASTLEEATKLFQAALDAYYILKPNAPVIRRQFLLSRKDDEALSEENQQAAQKLLNNEKARDQSRKLQRIKNLPHLGAIS